MKKDIKKNIKKNLKKGFTLIELIIVIAIIGVLALIATPRYLSYVNDAHVATMKADAKTLEGQVQTLYGAARAKGVDEKVALGKLVKKTETKNSAGVVTDVTLTEISKDKLVGILNRGISTSGGATQTTDIKSIEGIRDVLAGGKVDSKLLDIYQFDEKEVQGAGIKLKNAPQDYYLARYGAGDNLVVFYKQGVKDSEGNYFITSVQKLGINLTDLGKDKTAKDLEWTTK